MLKIALLLFISVGILQAAQKPTSFLDEEANAARYTHLPQTVSPHRKPDTSVQIDDEKSPLLQNTNTKKNQCCITCLCWSAAYCGLATSAILVIALFYGGGLLTAWSQYR